jgi:hypothetical protein
MNGTEADGKTKFEEVLKVRGVAKAEIAFSPKIDSKLKVGTAVTVTVTAPASSNSVGPQWYMKNSTIKAAVVMPRL